MRDASPDPGGAAAPARDAADPEPSRGGRPVEGPRRGDWPRCPAIYQVYPRSFQDSTGDGVGDLRGITDRLGHIADLGMDAVWLSPFYVSPLADGGYDVADHRAVDPRHGTLADFDALVARARALGLRVMIDMVFNHVSTEHVWFQRSLEGDEEAAARLVWRDPKPDGSPPNNWRSQFGPAAWSWHHKRRQYYHHQFLSCQPNVDLEHPAVMEDHAKTLRFWRDRGVTGFRFDAVTSYLFDRGLRDNPPASPQVKAKISGPPFSPYTYQDHVHDMLRGDGHEYMRLLRDWAGPDCWLMGENTSGNRSLEMAHAFAGPDKLDVCYGTDPVEAGGDPATFVRMLDHDEPEARVHLYWFSSHDQPRPASALGDGGPRGARFYAVLRAMLPGPALIFQGEELGLPQPDLSKEEVTDPFDLLYWPDGPGREGPRVPIPWEAQAPNFGFTTGTPWLPMRWDAAHAVDAQVDDPASPLAIHRAAVDVRREAGIDEATVIDAHTDGQLLRLTLTTADGEVEAAANFSHVAGATVEGLKGARALLETERDGARLGPLGAAIWRRTDAPGRSGRGASSPASNG
ncbi:MAG: alpha-amylase family glycosyl hydrolase [Paracoccaceae bacterium]